MGRSPTSASFRYKKRALDNEEKENITCRFRIFLSINMPFKALALDDKGGRIAEELAIKLSLGLRNKVFQGAIFPKP